MQFTPESFKTKKDKTVTLRMARPEEAESVLRAMIEIAETSDYLLVSADDFRKMKLEDEVKWINSYNEDPRACLILAEHENKIVGILDFRTFKNPKQRHRGGLGISLNQSLRGEGLGEILFKKLQTLTAQIEGLEQVELSVMGDNHRAYHLYKKVGFTEIGRKPRAYRQPNGNDQDEILMVKANA